MSTEHKETNAEYHADVSHVSNSMLKVFAESPQKYYQMFVAKTMPKPEQTPSLLLGSVVHCLFLEPEKFSVEYAVAPQVDRRTKVGKDTWSNFVDESDGKTVVPADVYATATAMVESLMSNELISTIIGTEGKIVEQPIRWIDDMRGLHLKAKPDIYIPCGKMPWNACIELKTSSSPGEGFTRQCANLRYHEQAAFYLEGCRECHDAEEQTRFLFIVVGVEPPHDAYCYYLGLDWLETAKKRVNHNLDMLWMCVSSDVWFSPESKVITELEMPKWLNYER